MAEIEDMAELTSVQSLSNFINRSTNQSMWWLGAKRKMEIYRWNSGNILPKSSELWGKGQPTDDRANCVHMCCIHEKLIDVPCALSTYSKIPFNPLCEK